MSRSTPKAAIAPIVASHRVYLGGMPRIRIWTASIAISCVTLSALSLIHASYTADVFAGLAASGLLLVCAVAFAVGIRIRAMRKVVVVENTWTLVPLLGAPAHMPPLVDLYKSGDDIVALGVNGRAIMLGVAGLFQEHDACEEVLTLLRRCNSAAASAAAERF